MATKKPVNKKLFAEIFGKDEVKRIESIENIDKTKVIISDYINSMVELIKKSKKKTKGVKLIEELYENKDSLSPSAIVFIVCENNDLSMKAMMQYALEPITLDVTFLENEDGVIDKFTSKVDYEVLSDEKKLREKCEAVIAKHYLFTTSILDKMATGDRSGLMKIAEHIAKKYKQAEVETCDASTNEPISRHQVVGDESGVQDFINSIS